MPWRDHKIPPVLEGNRDIQGHVKNLALASMMNSNWEIPRQRGCSYPLSVVIYGHQRTIYAKRQYWCKLWIFTKRPCNGYIGNWKIPYCHWWSTNKVFDKMSTQISRQVFKVCFNHYWQHKFIVYDSCEFKWHFAMQCNEFGIEYKPIIVRNPQAKSIKGMTRWSTVQ